MFVTKKLDRPICFEEVRMNKDREKIEKYLMYTLKTYSKYVYIIFLKSYVQKCVMMHNKLFWSTVSTESNNQVALE